MTADELIESGAMSEIRFGSVHSFILPHDIQLTDKYF